MAIIPKKTYLIIDDNRDVLGFLSSYVATRGAKKTLTATNGVEGITLAKNNAPDLVILDYEMDGGLNGLEVIDEFHKNDLDFPVIIISGHNDFELGMRAAQLGVSDFVNKVNWYEVLDLKINNAFHFGHTIAAKRNSSKEIIVTNLAILKDILRKSDNYDEFEKYLFRIDGELKNDTVNKEQVKKDLSFLQNATAGASGNLTAHAILEGISAIAGMV